MKTQQARMSSVLVTGCAAILLAGCDGPCVSLYCFPELGDAGSKASDLATYLAVQRADETVGGNVILGQAGPLGGKGRMAFALRANRISRTTPGVEGISVRTSGNAASDFPTGTGSTTALTVDVALPLWKGLSSGTSHIGGFDFTGSISALQGFPVNSLHLRSNSPFAPGFGFRIGLLEETPRLPGISYSRSVRFLPSFDFSSTGMPVVGGGTMTVGADNIDVLVTSWRFAASKRFGAVGLTAGIGGDSYTGSGSVNAALSGSTVGPKSGRSYLSFYRDRRNLFVGGSYTLRGVTMIGEYGFLSQTGSHPILVTNTVGGQTAGVSRDYLSLGVRLGSRR